MNTTTAFARTISSLLAATYALRLLGQDIGLEEIVVYAQKREANIQTVPISVQAVSGSDLVDLQINDLEELDAYVPDLSVTKASINTFVSIRGINSGANDGFEQSVALFIDTVYAGRGELFLTPFLDVERVEVLRGPQSVIFGKNTTAGAINLVSAKPTSEFDASLSGWYQTETDERGITAVVSGPVAENWRGRVALRTSESSGFVHNTAANRDEPVAEDWALRGTIEGDLSDRLSVLLKIEVGEFDLYGRRWQTTEPGLYLPLFRAFDPSFETVLDDTKSVSGLIDDEYDETDTQNFTLQIEYDFDPATLTSITSLLEFDVERLQDTDFSPLPLLATLTPTKEFDQLSQEVRLQFPIADRVDLLAGLLYQRADLGVSRRQDIAGSTFGLLLGLAGNPAAALAPLVTSSPFSAFDQSSEIASAFGHAQWSVSERTAIELGARYTQENKDVTQDMFMSAFQTTSQPITDPLTLALLGSFFGYQTHSLSAGRDESGFTTSLGVKHSLSDEAVLYASFATGRKSGGFNEEHRSASTVGFEFEDEQARSFELGAKLRFADDRARLNLVYFDSEFEDLQTSAFDGISFIVGNAAKASSQGVELDAAWQATDRLRVGGAAAVLDAEFEEYTSAPCMAGTPLNCTQDLSGRSTPFAPRYSGSLLVEYQRTLDRGFTTQVRFTVPFTDSYSFVDDHDPLDAQERHALLNARFGIGPSSGRWEAALLAENLADKRVPLYGNDMPVLAGAHIDLVNNARTWTVQFEMQFD